MTAEEKRAADAACEEPSEGNDWIADKDCAGFIESLNSGR